MEQHLHKNGRARAPATIQYKGRNIPIVAEEQIFGGL